MDLCCVAGIRKSAIMVACAARCSVVPVAVAALAVSANFPKLL